MAVKGQKKLYKTLSDRPTVQQAFWDMNRNCILAFQCYGLPLGCTAQWSRQCDNSRQLSDYALASPYFMEEFNGSTDFGARANQQGPRLQAELLEA